MGNTELIKELRALTQAGMKDCKESLEEAEWDLQKAVDIVKTKGLNIVSGREGKVASEGRAAILLGENSRSGSMVEVNCQTDFVANGEAFKNFADTVAHALADASDAGKPFDVADVETARTSIVSSTKENVVVRRWWVEQAAAENAVVFGYLHSNGKIGVLLTLLAPTIGTASHPDFLALGDDLAMQVAAMNPISVSAETLPPHDIIKQKQIFHTQLTEANKPQSTWDKIMLGKMNKWYTEVCLLNQESVVVPKTTIAQVVKNVGAKLGGEVQVVNFIRCQVGEGIEKKKENLADEVAKMM